MTRKSLGCRHDPKGLVVCCNEELAGARVGEFIALELAANVGCVFGAQVVRYGAGAVGSLDYDSLFGHSICLVVGDYKKGLKI